ncbi:hypothetical protein CDAR_207301 [Caerostris darwini]|uniref:Uncharacterized protein n=1 Tax=Caerostris darwini TaxID=1538125 RepID=A0AAV4MGG6_9ARAC|nr:hypothetical protein CDAR_207301 [Caerostris darwini]
MAFVSSPFFFFVLIEILLFQRQTPKVRQWFPSDNLRQLLKASILFPCTMEFIREWKCALEKNLHLNRRPGLLACDWNRTSGHLRTTTLINGVQIVTCSESRFNGNSGRDFFSRLLEWLI